jgi:hypothetical protein
LIVWLKRKRSALQHIDRIDDTITRYSLQIHRRVAITTAVRKATVAAEGGLFDKKKPLGLSGFKDRFPV